MNAAEAQEQAVPGLPSAPEARSGREENVGPFEADLDNMVVRPTGHAILPLRQDA